MPTARAAQGAAMGENRGAAMRSPSGPCAALEGGAPRRTIIQIGFEINENGWRFSLEKVEADGAITEDFYSRPNGR